jgi:hypothetical protein
MQHKPVRSSFLQSVAYDSSSKTLEVMFYNGRTTTHEDVEPEVYEGFFTAESAGRHYSANFKTPQSKFEPKKYR